MNHFISLIGVAFTFALIVAVTSAQPSSLSPNPLTQSVQKREANAGRDFYCPSKEERGSFCPEGQPRVSKQRGCTPLMRAAESGNIDEVRALLKAGADVNAAWPAWGHTALMFAAGEGHLEVVKALLAAGADPYAVAFGHGGVHGWAWMFAMNRCNKKWLEITDAMLAGGVKINPPSGIRMSPLGFAIEKNDRVIIDALLKRKADVNLRDQESGETALMYAVKYGSSEVVRVLLDAGADVNARDKDGRTALSIAEENKENPWHDGIVELLKRVGAQR
jgi:ankyrin repeat protein